MSERLISLEKKGGGGKVQRLVETVLWTNPSPTSSWAASNVTLNDSVENYEYLRFTYRVSTSDTTQYDDIFDVETLKKAINTVPAYRGYLGAHTTSSTNHIRTVIYIDNTTVQLTGAASTGGTSANNYCIPEAIYGLKYATPRTNVIDPSGILAGQLLVNNATKSVTIDTSKRYMVFASLLYTTSSSRSMVWFIENGLYTCLCGLSSYHEISISGTTLTLKGIHATLYSEFDVLQLDE